MDIPEILKEPPEEIKRELSRLQDELDNEVPRKILDENLLIATWNIRYFGGLTEKWRSSQNDSPRRDLHALRCIGEIISRFDIVAIQEAKGNIKALRHMLKLLGPNWSLVLTDVTKGSPGNNERMAFVFDTRRVQMSGLACELVVPTAKLSVIEEDALRKQFARTPYAVSFRAGGVACEEAEDVYSCHSPCPVGQPSQQTYPRAEGDCGLAHGMGKRHQRI